MTRTSKTDGGGRPTLKTIARISGMAVTTVSRALGDAPDISAETKEKVRKIANEIGYVPNRAGVRLRTGRTNVIALVLPTEDEVLNMTPRLISAISGALSGTPFHLIVMPELPEQDPIDPVRYIVETGSADAIILNRIAPEDARIAYLRDKGFPFVTHGRTIWQDQHAWYDFDNEAFAAVAIRTLAERGRRSILLIAPPQDTTYGQDIVRGATEAAAARGVRLSIAPVTSDDPREEIASRLADTCDGLPDLDGLISASPHAAMAAVGVIERRGHVIGRDFDIFAKETFPILEMFREGVLTLNEDIVKAGRYLARAAIHEVRSGGGDPMQEMDRPAGADPLPESRAARA